MSAGGVADVFDLGVVELMTDRDLLIRIAVTLERMEEFLHVACEPMVLRALKRRERKMCAVSNGFYEAFAKWMDKEEEKHGPCPPLVRRVLCVDAHEKWRQYVPCESLAFLPTSPYTPHFVGHWVQIPETLGWFAVPTARSRGPRSKSRREWEKWRKRRVGRKKKRTVAQEKSP